MINVEIKARCTPEQQSTMRALLIGVESPGSQRQVDTYFNVPKGRMKLRESRTENCLIHYERPDTLGPKVSNYQLVPVAPESPLKKSLVASLGVLVIVDKTREIYFVDNVKIHLDHIVGLGYFVEIEARDEDETIGKDKLYEQCNHWISQFGISGGDMIDWSYSDMMLKMKETWPSQRKE